MSLALTLPACVVAGYFIGSAIDGWLHTSLGKVIGIILGMTGGLIQILRELTRDAGTADERNRK